MGQFEYDVESINDKRMRITLTFKAKSKLFKRIFDNSKAILSKKKDINFDGTDSDLETFEVDKRFLNLIRTSIKKPINTVKNIIKKDNILYESYDVKSAIFKRKDKIWEIKIITEGHWFKF